MKIQYTVTKKDAFYVYFNVNKYLKSSRYLMLTLLIAFSLIFSWIEFSYSKADGLEIRIIVSIIMGLGVFIILLLLYKIGQIIQILLMLNLEKFRDVLCEHELIFTTEDLVEKTEYNQTIYKYRALNKIFFNKKYIVILTGALQVHIIPIYRMNDQIVSELETELLRIANSHGIDVIGK